ncbi:MAG: N-acetyltransferase [Pseudomonadota bacterium]
MFQLHHETQEDWWEIEALYDLCFAPGREALSSYRLREGVAPVSELCLVARDSDQILGGAIRVWPVQVETHKALLIGPIAVHPTRQGEGLGAIMIQNVLDKADASGWPRAMLVGDLPFYKRFGFFRLTGVAMPPPTNPERVLGVSIEQDAWNGISGQVQRMA